MSSIFHFIRKPRHLSLFLIFFLFFYSTHLSGQFLAPKLSDQARVSLLTCDPGQELYSVFGHSALWVYDPYRHIDRVYNYGTFDFDTPHFYLKFMRGRLNYKLSVSTFNYFYQDYVRENRSVREQVLNLTSKEKQLLFQLLETNYLPENRYYRYDFFYDNCSTRIRDIVFKASGNRFILPENSDDHKSFRALLESLLAPIPWVQTGIFLLLTRGADQPASDWEYMFLPNRMEELFSVARDTDNLPLVSGSRTIFKAQNVKAGHSSWAPPVTISLVILLISVLLFMFRNPESFESRLFDSLLFLLIGLTGSLFLFMWVFSAHQVSHANLNLVWAFPLHLIIPVLVWFRRSGKFLKSYTRILLVLMVPGLFMMIFGTQQIPVVGYVLFLVTALRLTDQSGWLHPVQKKPE